MRYYKMLKRIIFDIDNTVLISREDIPKCLFIGLIKSKIKPTIKLMKQIGHAMQEYEDKFPKYDKKAFIDFFNSKHNYNFDYHFYDSLNNAFMLYSRCKPNKNIAKVLEYLSDKYEIVALSNYLTEVQYNRLKKRDLVKYFKEIYGGDMALKPNKEAYLMACGNHKIEECLFIGDSLTNDYLGVEKIGGKAILYDKKNKYKDSNYDRIKDFIELEKRL